MSTSFECAQLTDPGEVDALQRILCQSFNFETAGWESFFRRVGQQNFRIVRRNGDLAGGLAMYPIGQWFGGRSIPMAGVAAVGIAPEHRGVGAAAELMAVTLRELHEQGVALSALYASTQRVYRKVGYEQAGTAFAYEQPLHSVDIVDRSLAVRAVEPRRHELFQDVARERAKRTNGNLDRNTTMWERVVERRDKEMYAYLIGETDRPEGYVIFFQESKKREPHDIHVADMAATTPAAGRCLWTLFSDHRSIAGNVVWRGPASEPLLNLTAEQTSKVRWALRWMLRIVDARRALSMRGYPHGVEGELHLDIEDELLPANRGRIVLEVAEGRGEIREGGEGTLRTDILGLAPLYTGLFTPGQLSALGLLDAEADTLATASLLFAGPEPWMPDMF